MTMTIDANAGGTKNIQSTIRRQKVREEGGPNQGKGPE